MANGQPAARPVFLYSEALNGTVPVDRFDLDVALWGRVAIAHRSVVETVLAAMGVLGLHNGGSVRFEVQSIEWSPIATLEELAARFAAQSPRRLLLQFPVPFRFTQTVTYVDGHQSRHTMAAGELPIQEILANCAYHTAAWDLEDRARTGLPSWEERHALAKQARQHAREVASGVQVLHSELQPAFVGHGRSRSNGQGYPQDGFVGQAELGGDLTGALPWLVSLAMGGGGQHRADGFGVVRLWQPPAFFHSREGEG